MERDELGYNLYEPSNKYSNSHYHAYDDLSLSSSEGENDDEKKAKDDEVDLTPASNYGGAVDLSDHDEPELQYAEASPIDSKANVNVKEEEEEEENLKMPRHAVSVLHRVTEEKAPMDEMLIKESAIILKHGSVWNYKFQKYMASTDELTKWIKLQKLAEDFVTAAENYGRIIITEFDAKLYDKKSERDYAHRVARLTIKPCTSIGGAAGGVKFIHHGILFKFALDWTGIYGGNDEWAMKTAKLEMKGIRCLEWANVTGLCYPLFAVIQLNGYSLIAQSLLPISKETLCYGSVDGGQTFVCSDDEAHRKLLALGERLNLHRVQVVTTSGQVIEHAGPIDLEVHKGRDGLYYVIDTARLMPAEGPDPNRSVFAHCLRPAFVVNGEAELVSDMFTMFMSMYKNFKKKTLWTEHVDAVDRLKHVDLTTLLKLLEVPNWLPELEYPAEISSGQSTIGDQRGIDPFPLFLCNVHHLGFNYRHLGYIVEAARRYLDLFKVKLEEGETVSVTEQQLEQLRSLVQILTTEGVARTLKNLTWEVIRTAKASAMVPSKTKLNTAIFNFLKDFFAAPIDDSKRAWLGLYEEVQYRFPKLLDGIKGDDFESVMDQMGWGRLLRRFSVLSGIELSKRVHSLKNSKREQIFEPDIVRIVARTAMMSVLEMATAKAFLARAKALALKKGARSVEIDRLVVELAKESLTSIRSHLVSAPLIDPEMTKIYNNACGRHYFFLGRIYNEGQGVETNLSEALKWFSRASDFFEENATCNVGQAYHDGRGVEKDFVKALEWFKKSAGLGSKRAHYLIGQMFEKAEGVSQDYQEAMRWYKKAAGMNNPTAQKYAGDLYFKGLGVEQDFAMAASFYRKAIEQNLSGAQFALGSMYENGQGVEKNLTEAIKLYSAAAGQGVAEAKAAVGTALLIPLDSLQLLKFPSSPTHKYRCPFCREVSGLQHACRVVCISSNSGPGEA